VTRGHVVAGVIGALVAAVVALTLALVLGKDDGGSRSSGTQTSAQKRYLSDYEPGAEQKAIKAIVKFHEYCDDIAVGVKPPSNAGVYSVAVDQFTRFVIDYPAARFHRVLESDPERTTVQELRFQTRYAQRRCGARDTDDVVVQPLRDTLRDL
jgi:hypothetical protein